MDKVGGVGGGFDGLMPEDDGEKMQVTDVRSTDAAVDGIVPIVIGKC